MSDDDHLHSIIADYGDACAEMQALRKRYDDAERGVSRDLRKRVGELEGLFSHVGVETHKWFDPECGHEGCQSLVLKARAEQAEAQLATANVHRDAAIASSDAFAIELVAKDARIAELENKNSYNLQIVREATAHIAQAAVIKKMREALELVLKYAHAWLVPSSLADVARAALAALAALAPSPAGREERHEMTSIGDKEPD